MAQQPGYYIVRREGEGEEGHIERLEAPPCANMGWYWYGIGSEIPEDEPYGDIIAGPFTMAQICAALRQPVATSEPN